MPKTDFRTELIGGPHVFKEGDRFESRHWGTIIQYAKTVFAEDESRLGKKFMDDYLRRQALYHIRSTAIKVVAEITMELENIDLYEATDTGRDELRSLLMATQFMPARPAPQLHALLNTLHTPKKARPKWAKGSPNESELADNAPEQENGEEGDVADEIETDPRDK